MTGRPVRATCEGRHIKRHAGQGRAPKKPTPRAPAPAPARYGRRRWLHVALILLAGGLVYANALTGPFVLDDRAAIVDNSQIRNWTHLTAVLSPDANSPAAGRPLVNLSFALNFAAGGLDVRGYHLVNLAIHLASALLAFALVRRTLANPRVKNGPGSQSEWFALAAVLLWTIHPLNSEVVDYVTQRTESMMALFYLLTLYAALRALESGHGRWTALAVVSCGLGMACKESMVTAPVMVALYDRVFLFDSWRDAWRRRRALYIGTAAAWIPLAMLVWSGPRAAVGGPSSGISAWTYLLNQAVMIPEYLRLSVCPHPLVVFYGWPLPLTVRDVLPYALLVLVLLAGTVVALIRKPPLGFAGAWFFITLAPTSSVVAIATEVGAERRMYLPLLAVVVLGVVLCERVWRLVARAVPRVTHAAPAVAGLALAASCVVLGVLTVLRNREYASPLTLARTVVERRPSAVAEHMLGEQLLLAQQTEEAVAHLRRAVAGGNSRAAYPLGLALIGQGKASEGVEQLQAFVATEGKPLVPRWLEPPFVDLVGARVAMGEVFLSQGRTTDAQRQAEAVLAVAPGHVGAKRLLAAALFAAGNYADAAIHYEQYMRARPGDVAGWINLGLAFVGTGRLPDALMAFRRAVAVDPAHATARRLLAMALLDSGLVDDAIAEAREALALNPGDPAARDVLNGALARR